MSRFPLVASLLIVVFSSCTTIQTMCYERLCPADVVFVEQIRKVGIVNNMPAVQQDYKQVDYASASLEGDGAVTVEALAQEVASAEYFDEVVVYDKQFRRSSYPLNQGWAVTGEVTPHHLGLSVAENDPSLRHIVNPPLRSEQDRQAMIHALLDGTADCISTDHAPHTAQDKANGAPGFSGLETAYGVCNSVLVQGINGSTDGRTITASQLSRLMAANPARILGLHHGEEPRGLLEQGFVADLVLCHPTAQWTVCGKAFASKGKYTPLEGKVLTGKVLTTYHRGREVFKSE